MIFVLQINTGFHPLDTRIVCGVEAPTFEEAMVATRALIHKRGLIIAEDKVEHGNWYVSTRHPAQDGQSSHFMSKMPLTMLTDLMAKMKD